MSKAVESQSCIFDFIIPGLFIGNVEATSSPRLEDIHTIINLSQVIYIRHEDKVYIDFDLSDSLSENIKPVFERTLPIIHESIMGNKKVLVQCCDGTSRSAAVVIAYLMKYYNLSLIESLFYVKNIRHSPTKPNLGFFVQLQDMEMDLYGKISISLPQYSKL